MSQARTRSSQEGGAEKRRIPFASAQKNGAGYESRLKRLELYGLRIQIVIASGDPIRLGDALVDISEAHGGARRFYNVSFRLLNRDS